MLSNKDIDEILASGPPSEENRLSNEDIDEILNSKPEKSESGFLDHPRVRSLGRGARNIANAGAGFLDMFGAPLWHTATSPARLLGKEIPYPSLRESTKGLIDTQTKGRLKPKNDWEKIEDSVMEGVATLPFGGAAASGAKALKYAGAGTKAFANYMGEMFAPTLRNIAGTAGASGLAQHSLNVMPDSPIAALGMGLLGGSIGNKAGKFASNVASKNVATPKAYLAEKLSFDPHAYEKLTHTDLNAPITLGDVSKSSPVKRTVDSLSKSFFGSKPIQNIHKGQAETVGQNVKFSEHPELTHNYASNIMVDAAKKKMKDTHSVLSRLEGKIDDTLRGKENSDRLIDVSKPIREFAEQLSDLRDETSTTMLLDSKLGKRIKQIIKTSGGPDIDQVAKQGGMDQGDAFLYALQKVPKSGYKIDFKTGRMLRRDIDNQISTWGTLGNIDQSQLKHLRHGLKESLHEYTESIADPEFQKAWKQHQTLSHNYLENEVPVLNAILAAKKKGDIEPFMLLARKVKDPKEAKLIMKSISSPSEREDLTQHLIQNLGTHGKNGFNFGTLESNFNALQPEAKKVFLMGLNPADQKKFISNMEAIKLLKLKETNASGTSYSLDTKSVLNAAASSAYSLATGDMTPLLVFFTTHVALPAGASKLVTSRPFIDSLYKSFKAKTPAQQALYLGKISKNPDFKKTMGIAIAKNLVRSTAVINQQK